MMWDGFFEAAQTMSNPLNTSYADMYGRAAEEWRNLAQQSMGSLMDSEGNIKNVAERVAASQNTMMQLFSTMMEAWQTLSPMMASGGDWQKMLSGYRDLLKEQMLRMQSMMPMTGMLAQAMAEGDSSKLWQQYMQSMPMLQAMMAGSSQETPAWLQPWLEASKQFPMMQGTDMLRNMSAAMSAMNPNANRMSGMQQLTGAYWNALEPYLQSPTIGYTRELEGKVRQSFIAWVETQQASMEYQTLMADIGSKAFEAMVHKLAERAEQRDPISSYKELVNTWVNVADDIFLSAFYSEAYNKTQGKLLNSSMAYRLRSQEVTEVLLQAQGMPTRREIDESYQSMHALQKELRMLKRELQNLKQQSSASPEQPVAVSAEGSN